MRHLTNKKLTYRFLKFLGIPASWPCLVVVDTVTQSQPISKRHRFVFRVIGTLLVLFTCLGVEDFCLFLLLLLIKEMIQTNISNYKIDGG